MPTSKPRFSITLTEELYQKVNAYQHERRFPTQTKAIIDLIQRGAQSLGLDFGGIGREISDAERRWIQKYRALDERGKETVDTIFNLECTRCEKPKKTEAFSEELMPNTAFVFEKEYHEMNKREKLDVLEKELDAEEKGGGLQESTHTNLEKESRMA